MSIKDKKEILEETVELANKAGINSCDVIFSEGQSFNTSAQNGEVETYKLSASKTIGIRVIHNQRVGLSYSESLDTDSLKIMIDKAIENSKFSKVNQLEVISNESKESFVFEEQTKLEEPKKLVELALELEKKTLAKDKRIAAVPYNGVSQSSSSLSYLNSNGSFTFESDYSFSCYTSALIRDGVKNSMHYKGSLAKSMNKLNLDKCIEESYKHASQWLDASSLKSGKYSVIFELSQLESLFSAFMGVFSAKASMEKNNPLAEKYGKEIFSSKLSIKDCPNYEKSLFKSKVDAEGFLQEDLTLVDKGVLANFFHNSVTSKHFKTQNNFRASRGARTPLGVSGSNILISKGDCSEKDIQSGEYLHIYSMQGLHSGLNFMSGDFSFGASGYLMNNGEVIRAVNGVTVAGNFYKMLVEIESLGDEIIGNDAYSFMSPQIRFSNLTIAGNA